MGVVNKLGPHHLRGELTMPYLLAETVLEDFDLDWRPSWTEPERIFTVTDSQEDPSLFIGYGTDGTTSFRVKAEKDKFLQAFRDLMERELAREVRLSDVIIDPPPFPNALVVQEAFDTQYGLARAA